MRPSRKIAYISIPFFLLACGAVAVPVIRAHEGSGVPKTLTVPPGSVIEGVHTNLARYNPGQPVTLAVDLSNKTSKDITSGTLELVFYHLNQQVGKLENEHFSLKSGAKKTLRFTWTPPQTDFQGYSVEAWARGDSGKVLDNLNSAVDVSSSWTKFPRYGYISTYPSQTTTATTKEIAGLKNNYIDGIQFYDWQYMHQHPLAGTVSNPASSWENIDGKLNYRKTVLDAIKAAHQMNMVAMNYDLIYGAWNQAVQNGSAVSPKWGLWKDILLTEPWTLPMPSGWATSAIDVMDPTNTKWQNYIIGQEAKVFQAYPFDGWQADQVGDWGTMYNASGKRGDYESGFVPLLNKAKQTLQKQVIFNDVGAFGLADVAKHSNDKIVYVECWPNNGQQTYEDLKNVIDQTEKDSKGTKSVILAAYMDRSYAQAFNSVQPGKFKAPGVLLTEATIDASGGDHIALGDHGNMLDNEYYPNHNLVMSATLKQQMYNYNTFMVAYENLLRGGLRNTSNTVTLKGIKTSQDASVNTVWTFTKSGGGHDVIQLINLLGESSNDWADAYALYSKPTAQKDITVKYYYGSGTVKSVNFASPDYQDGKSYNLRFTKGKDSKGSYVAFTVPSLQYWDMIYLSKS